MNPLFVTRGKTPKGIRKISAQGQRPGTLKVNCRRTLKEFASSIPDIGLVVLNPVLLEKALYSPTLTEFWNRNWLFDPGRCPGLKFANASGVLDSSSMLTALKGRAKFMPTLRVATRISQYF